MNAMFSMSPGSAMIEPDPTAALLRTISEVLDIRDVFPKVSEIVKSVVPHDALELVFNDRDGRATLEAASTDDLPGYAACTGPDDEPFSILSDIRWGRRRNATGDSSDAIDALLEAGYRSALSVRRVAQSQAMRLVFFSKRADAYSANDVPPAQHVADYVALAVANERVDARVRTLAEKGEALPHGRMIGRSPAWQRVVTRALRVAPTDATVFLQGESGTGKEVVARFVHARRAPRAQRATFVSCATCWSPQRS